MGAGKSRRTGNADGTVRPQPRYGMMTMVAEKRNGTWLVVVWGLTPELQDLTAPVPSRREALMICQGAVGYGKSPRTSVASATRPTARIMAPARGGT